VTGPRCDAPRRLSGRGALVHMLEEYAPHMGNAWHALGAGVLTRRTTHVTFFRDADEASGGLALLFIPNPAIY
jgi:hypothetical protein